MVGTRQVLPQPSYYGPTGHVGALEVPHVFGIRELVLRLQELHLLPLTLETDQVAAVGGSQSKGLSSQQSSVPSQVQCGYNTQNTADFWGNSLSSSDSSPVPVNEEESEGSQRFYDKWTEPQECFLIDLWGEYNNELESAQSR